MFSRARAAALAALVAALALTARVPEGQAKAKKAYWLVSFLGGVLAPLGDTADQRDVGLGVGLRIGWTSKIGLGLAVSAQYSPLPVSESSPPDGMPGDDVVEVVENHFAAAALVPRFTLGRGPVRLSIGAGGGGILERTRSRPAGATGAASSKQTVVAGAALGEVGIETYLWESGGLVVTGSYLRSFGEREAEIGALLGGLVFTFR